MVSAFLVAARAASVTRLRRSAPTRAGVIPAVAARSASGARGPPAGRGFTMAPRPRRSGGGRVTRVSRRPGRVSGPRRERPPWGPRPSGAAVSRGRLEDVRRRPDAPRAIGIARPVCKSGGGTFRVVDAGAALAERAEQATGAGPGRAPDQVEQAADDEQRGSEAQEELLPERQRRGFRAGGLGGGAAFEAGVHGVCLQARV